MKVCYFQKAVVLYRAGAVMLDVGVSETGDLALVKILHESPGTSLSFYHG